MNIDPLVREAILEKMSRFDAELSTLDQRVERARMEHDKAVSDRAEVASKRQKLAGYLGSGDDDLGDLSVLPWSLPTTPMPVAKRKTTKDVVLAKAKGLLAGGCRMKSEDIYNELRADGVDLGIHGPRRITQIMSDSRLFDSHRPLGWGLKPESAGNPTEAVHPAADEQLALEGSAA